MNQCTPKQGWGPTDGADVRGQRVHGVHVWSTWTRNTAF